mgnify:CR=1 FL=1
MEKKTEFKNPLVAEFNFLVSSAQKFIENMKNMLEISNLEAFIRAFKQFHRIVGEIFAYSRLLKTQQCIANGETPEIIERALLEVDHLLQLAFELEEKYVRLMNGRRKN